MYYQNIMISLSFFQIKLWTFSAVCLKIHHRLFHSNLHPNVYFSPSLHFKFASNKHSLGVINKLNEALNMLWKSKDMRGSWEFKFMYYWMKRIIVSIRKFIHKVLLVCEHWIYRDEAKTTQILLMNILRFGGVCGKCHVMSFVVSFKSLWCNLGEKW